MLARHDEQLADHARSLANVLLNELRARDADEAAVGVMSDCPGEERLAGTRRAVEQDALGLGDAERLEKLWVLNWELNHLLDLLDLLVETADHLVRRVGHLLNHHERDERVNLVGQDLVQLVRVGPECDPEVGR